MGNLGLYTLDRKASGHNLEKHSLLMKQPNLLRIELQEQLIFPLVYFFMPSRQKVKAKRSIEMDSMLSDFDNMDVVYGDEISNPIEQELANTINGSVCRNDIGAFSNNSGNSSQENEYRDFNNGIEIPRQDRPMESKEIFSNETSLRPSKEMDSLMSMMHSQINRVINSATSDRDFPEIQNIMRSLSSGHWATESGTSGNNQENS